MQGTLTIRGHKLRTKTQRRYIVVRTGLPTYTLKRTDNIDTARAERRKATSAARPVVVVDTITGEEVA